ncbi:hypothetical protein GpartN1_g543.t1 [Galdieria partita]|uniref:Argininosuccinate lyase n=1 Tax=Galdieria partita TaxID=83374 RepID=A0A9C7UMM1_9RHOD|nr:hypothetical protein GpartN1_g543.t1 [Galdieria partita]
MWCGRFTLEPHEMLTKFSESVSFDWRLYRHDIDASIAHARMLGKQGIVPKEEVKQIEEGLENIRKRIDEESFEFSAKLEDIHMNIEKALTDLIGEAGARLHSGRSRNDQIATDIRLFIREEIDQIRLLIEGVQRELVKLSAEHTETIFPGYTHLQHAQPVVFAHHLLAYVEMLERDKDRLSDCKKRVNILPLGSAALAGTTLPLDREFVATSLGFSDITRNSMDAVSDRDFILEFLSCISIMAIHISRFSEDVIFWFSQEVSFIEIGDQFCTGSSLMPQKKNPDILELARGRTGQIIGNLVSLLVVMKGLPMCYNRDIQEDKIPLMNSIDVIKGVLAVLAPMISSITANKSKMLAAASDPALMATDLAEWLVRRNVPFRLAHHRVGRFVGYCRERNIPLNGCSFEELKLCIPEADETCLELWDPKKSVSSRDIFGGTAPRRVRQQLEFWNSKEFMREH